MSPQIIELLIFAVIAFFIINKLITTLGSTSEEEQTKQKSYFGEPVIKDVTYNTVKSNKEEKNIPAQDIKTFKDIIVEHNITAVVDGMEQVHKRLYSFDPVKFINNAKTAFQMIIEAAYKKDTQELSELIDKRYLEEFEKITPSYGDFFDSSALSAKYSEIYMFGNNIFIKLLFQGKNVVDKIEDLKEEWTFTRNANAKEVDWFLSNIERV
ncbi:tim44-like domain protein [Rickettsia endosymbiont of Ixodes pacificus]|uniref:Tim44 domain-containing protein n=1 Tax=Rickettsia endosymbiont of Ixodes pacificus TaxID=1133329 RepID=UPI0005F857B6|nr:Tim44 domain-containing protein [Rickettsia endosymbiont of Ixodes pacificus]KJW02772.1 tim44-like domain protein [Rickettsia endosymbiont of Ixodes pacificus]